VSYSAAFITECFFYMAWSLIFALPNPTWAAQQNKNIPRLGYLLTGFELPEEFLLAMKRLGYIEGQNVGFEYLAAEGTDEKLLGQASELVRRKVAAIIAPGASAALAAKKATTAIPIVYLGGGDPVEVGLVRSLARPGGNVTGVTELSRELTSKRLELLKETFPKISSVAVLAHTSAPGVAAQVRELDKLARGLALKLHIAEIRGEGDLQDSLSTVLRHSPDALIEVPNPVFHANSSWIASFAAQHKLPTVFHSRDFVDSGGLMAYGAAFPELYGRVAVLVDKILKGAKPADLPVEQPTKFELVINLKTAKQIGLTIPPNVLARADRVIK
jgi:putative tryptophan/tyrosine transport system substrate-binding protein